MPEQAKHVLIAEDNTAMRAVISFALEAAGFGVTPVGSGQMAWDALVGSDVDLVVTDHDMPGMTGGELCKRMRQDARFAQTPVILLTAKGIELNTAHFLGELSVSAIISKPFSPRELTETVQDCLAARTTRA